MFKLREKKGSFENLLVTKKDYLLCPEHDFNLLLALLSEPPPPNPVYVLSERPLLVNISVFEHFTMQESLEKTVKNNSYRD